MAQATWLPAFSSAGPDWLAARPVLYDTRERFRATLLRESGLAPDLVARCEQRVAWLLGAQADEPLAADQHEQAVFAYVDAFVRDPHDVTDAHVVALRAFLTVPQVVGLTEMLALLDGFVRFRLILADGAA